MTQNSASEARRASRIDLHDMLSFNSSLNLADVVRRQFWLVCACISLCVALAMLYWLHAPVWYESVARVLVSQKDPRLATSAAPGNAASVERVVNEDILANHMEVVRSPRIVEMALYRSELTRLPSILAELDEDTTAADYVISHIELTRGGEGAAKEARTLNIAFQHTDPGDAQKVLEAIVREYQGFLGAQMEQAMTQANLLIREAQQNLEGEMAAAQQEYVEARKSAPVLFSGAGSSNVYLDQFKKIHDEMLQQEMLYSSMKTRLQRVRAALEKHRNQGESSDKADLELLALIDTASLERLGVFAGLQTNSARTAEFQAAQPARLEEAQTEYTHLLKLMSEERRLKADFGDAHPSVVRLRNEIELVKSFIADQAEKTDVPWEDAQITPAMLVNAYIGFLENDLASIEERRTELKMLAVDAEAKAKSLIEFELRDDVLRTSITRKQKLFDGVVEQIRDLDTASGLSGYIHELLEAPNYGEKVWPSLKLCGVGGIFLGLIFGIGLGIANDKLDGRFHSPEEIDRVIDLPIVGRIGRITGSKKKGVAALVANELSPESEAFRLIRTMLLPRIKAGTLKRLAVTSPIPGDGKSTVIANLAAAFAKVDLDVLLIDADMRRPTIHKLLDADNDRGLSEVLRDEVPLDEALRKTDIEGLSVLTSGLCPENPAELLESSRFDHLLETLNERFAIILIDVGPVLAVSDPCVVAKKVDGMLIVVRASNDTKDQARDAVGRLRSVGAEMQGCVINTYGSGKEFEQSGGYYGYYGDSYTITNAKSNGKAKTAAPAGATTPAPRSVSAKPGKSKKSRSRS